MKVYLAVVAGIMLGASGCMDAHGAPTRPASDVLQQAHDTNGPAWSGLLKPVAIHAAADGRVYVADRGDGKVRVFTPEGRPIHEFGSTGDGPGEFRNVRTIIVSHNTVNVFDGKPTRLLRLSLTGAYQASVPIPAFGDEMISGLGTDRIVFASSARWAFSPTGEQGPRPLARIVDSTGAVVGGIGQRSNVSSPFASHIINFVIPAGTRDGKFVWLARLNSPEVLLYQAGTGTVQAIARTLPYKPEQLSPEYIPTSMKVEPGKPFVPPFDAVTYGVATDGMGRAYVLTALQSSRAAGGEPQRMSVDIITPGVSPVLRRYRVSGFYSAITVSPDGRQIYLLNATSGDIKRFERS